ncbi:NosD domain-containing protein [Candidatus Lokiarchaeum ossiferum]|uniref:NosD domain-containing protein n=1 Tax=Candidatus Lokiarchaeum ossiferum TaxID=2951803 RepID=UPI00352EC690
MYNTLHKGKNVVIIFCLLISFVLTTNDLISSDERNSFSAVDSERITPLSGASFENTSITIDAELATPTSNSGNWTWAALQPWCTGLGTIESPYVIQNITFNITENGIGLYILDSENVYFTIKECTFFHLSTTGTAIKFERTTNGTISNCNMTTNQYGVTLVSSDYNTIADNYVNDCSYGGIYLLNYCNYNNITHNEVSSITVYAGVYLLNQCNFNIIQDNNCSLARNGIRMDKLCEYNQVLQNYCFDNWAGIDIGSCSFNIFWNNTVDHNIYHPSSLGYGIGFNEFESNGFSTYNNVSFNIVTNNKDGGIRFRVGMNNTIHNNSLSQNGPSYSRKGIILESSDYNQIYNNTEYQSNIYLLRSDENIITDNLLESGNRGIDLYNSYNNSVLRNEIQDFSYGISGSDDNSSPGKNNTVIGNHISESVYYDIDIDTSDCWTLKENIMESGGLGLYNSFNNSIDQSNTVYGLPILFFENQNNLNLNGSTLTGFSQIFVVNSENSRISNLNISNLAIGLSIVGGNNLLIENNNLSNNELFGLYLNNVNNSVITNNILRNGGTGIYLDTRIDNGWDVENPDYSVLQFNNTFTYNVVSDNGYSGFDGKYSAYNVIRDNEFNNNSDYGLELTYFHNSTLMLNNISFNDYGIEMGHSHDNIISMNHINNNTGTGMILEYSNRTILEENQLCFNEYGAEFYDTHDNFFQMNNVSNNVDTGLLLECSNRTIMKFNSFCFNGKGVLLSDTFHCEVIENDVLSNLEKGIILEYTNFSIISENNIFDNQEIGLQVWEESGQNIIYENKFRNNILHADDSGMDNQWYFSSKGNYWDNYTGTDDDHNGIGDQPYSIAGNAGTMDIYPIHDLDAPIISSVDSLLISGKISYEISWNVTDFNPDDYSILLDGEILTSDQKWQNGAIKYLIPANTLEDGSYNYTLQVEDKYGNQKTAETTVIVDGTSPTISSISAYNITGNVNLTLSWNINDTHPLYFVVSQNQTLQTTPVVWENGSVSYTIPALSLADGNYLYQIWVNDSLGNARVFDTLVVVDGTAPIITSDQDLILSSDSSSILLNWTLNDIHPGVYSISVNGSVVVTSTAWINGLIFYNYSLADLPAGNYTVQITVYDSFGNGVVNSIQISIPAGVDENDPINPWVLVIVGIGIGGGVVGLIVVIKRAKEDND